MSLDITLCAWRCTDDWQGSLTDNLASMARQIHLSDGNTLYKILWESPYSHAGQIVHLLEEALTHLEQHTYEQQFPVGTQCDLMKFLESYIIACSNNLDARIEIV